MDDEQRQPDGDHCQYEKPHAILKLDVPETFVANDISPKAFSGVIAADEIVIAMAAFVIMHKFNRRGGYCLSAETQSLLKLRILSCRESCNNSTFALHHRAETVKKFSSAEF